VGHDPPLKWEQELSALKARLAPAFGRAETRTSANAFIDGLLSEATRKTGLATGGEAGLARPYRMQSLLNWANRCRLYTAVFETFMLTTLPNELTAAVAGAQGAGAVTPATFDKRLNGGLTAVAEILKNASVGPEDGSVGALFIAIGFLVFIASHIMLGLAITVGPLFVAMPLWEKTVHLFSAWISTMLGLIMAQVLIVALLALPGTNHATEWRERHERQ
jgi:hypothetical protein